MNKYFARQFIEHGEYFYIKHVVRFLKITLLFHKLPKREIFNTENKIRKKKPFKLNFFFVY